MLLGPLGFFTGILTHSEMHTGPISDNFTQVGCKRKRTVTVTEGRLLRLESVSWAAWVRSVGRAPGWPVYAVHEAQLPGWLCNWRCRSALSGASEGCSRGVAGLSAHEAPGPLCYSRSRPVRAQVETPQTVSTDVFSKGGCAVRWHRLILSSEDLRWTCCGVLGLFTIH